MLRSKNAVIIAFKYSGNAILRMLFKINILHIKSQENCKKIFQRPSTGTDEKKEYRYQGAGYSYPA